MRNVVNADAEAEPAAAPALATLDLPFLAQQTFDDSDLAREVLILFADQARRVVPTLSGLAPTAQREAAHLLKGSARGIGAWAAAAIAEAYETAAPEARAAIHPDLAATFAATQAAIEAELRSGGAPPPLRPLFIAAGLRYMHALAAARASGRPREERDFMASITFTDSKGTPRTVEGADGSTLMETAVQNGVPEIVAECGGACACATCHVYVDDAYLAKVGKASGMEEDMLDFAYEVKPNSRLSCQIKITPALDGLHVTTPSRQG